MKLSLYPLAALSLLSSTNAGDSAGCFENARHFHPDDWAFCQPIGETDDAHVFLYYTPFPQEGNVMLGLYVTQDSYGWSSLAIGGNGGMKGASQVVVRMEEDGEWIAEDRFSEDYVTPTLDELQDVKLLFANQTEDGETSWGVLIPMNSCDNPHDYPIKDAKMYMHWALGTDHAFSFHGKRKGPFHVNLLKGPKEEPSTEGLEYVDIMMPNVPVVMGEGGTDPTNPYVCSLFDMKELSGGRFGEEKVHVTRFSPILDAKEYTHHMLLYSCSSDAVEGLEHGHVIEECESMPRGCNEIQWTWSVGGRDTIFPPDVGVPLDEEQRFVMIQMHYFNGNLDPEVFDSSGIRAYFTTDLRENEAGVMLLNGGVSDWQRPALPSGISSYQLSPFVVPHDCTLKAWTGPLNILSVGHHMHLHGTRMEINVERDGRNLGLMREEHHYDFKHQGLDEPNPALKTLLPGDQVIVKCTYDTSNAEKDIGFGDLTQQEMCVSPIYYYPRQDRDSFGYSAPRANVSHCLEPATEESFVAQNASLCEQELVNNVVETLGYGRMMPMSFGLLEACNGGSMYSLLLDRVDGICPDCQANSDCTEEEIMQHARGFCVNHCEANLNVSLYPDLSRTEAWDAATYGCPGETRNFQVPQLLDPPQCQAEGNLSQVIQLQPVMSSGTVLKMSSAFLVSALVGTLMLWL